VENIELSGHRVTVTIRLRTDVKYPKDQKLEFKDWYYGERHNGMILGDSSLYFNPGDTIVGLLLLVW
jgi:phospholipid/cholesterol/gamma-HCH transport system substrate-binding protein